MAIRVEHEPDPQRLGEFGVFTWPIWTCEPSTFPWQYEGTETCYLLEGDVTVTPDGGTPVRIRAGDLVTFPDGMACTWQVHTAVRKHYTFE